MEEEIASLRQAISDYEAQLSQIQLAIGASSAGPDQDNLMSLKLDIEELITLTKENLSGIQNQVNGSVSSACTSNNDTLDHLDREYALLKAELEDSETKQEKKAPDIQEDLTALQGMKCQAPHRHQWGEVSYHNALVCSVEEKHDDISSMDQIQVRVMFTNPTHQDMLPCPYYLEGECRFSEQQCRFSHGEVVTLSSLKEYKEPDFSVVRPGLQVLVKQTDKLWHRSVILTCNKCSCEVKLESSGKKVEVNLDCILPMDSGQDVPEDYSEDDSEEDSDVEVDPSLIQQSLLTTPASSALGEWEKHTKGIGSRLMAQMGYVIGTGLGRNGEGRIEPVEAMIFPAGKSLDHCMTLREKAGGDENLFKVEKRLRRLQRKQERQSERQYEREKQRTNVFDFINSKLGGKKGDAYDLVPEASKSVSSRDNKSIKSESSRGLNVVGFRVGEEIRRAERDLARLQESLSRHEQGSSTHKSIASKMEDKQSELSQLRASERSIDLERNQRKDRKKLTIF